MFDSDSQLRVFPFQMILGEKLEYRNSLSNVRSICFRHHARSLQPIFSQRIVWAEQVLLAWGICPSPVMVPVIQITLFSDLPSGQVGPIFLSQETPGDCARSCRMMLQVYISFYIENSGPPKWLVFSFFSKLHIYVCMAGEKEETSESGSC